MCAAWSQGSRRPGSDGTCIRRCARYGKRGSRLAWLDVGAGEQQRGCVRDKAGWEGARRARAQSAVTVAANPRSPGSRSQLARAAATGGPPPLTAAPPPARARTRRAARPTAPPSARRARPQAGPPCRPLRPPCHPPQGPQSPSVPPAATGSTRACRRCAPGWSRGWRAARPAAPQVPLAAPPRALSAGKRPWQQWRRPGRRARS